MLRDTYWSQLASVTAPKDDCTFLMTKPKLMPRIIVPLVKSKTGNMNDANNYRAIALSNAVSKILESFLTVCQDYL